MRKLTVFLLISLIALQAAFAAAGSACLHEGDAGARHFGHHAHALRTPTAGAAAGIAAVPDEAAATASPDLAPAADAGDPDHDCTTCHANALSGMPARPLLPALPAGVVFRADAAHLPPPSPPPRRPERPNWHRTHPA